LGSFVTPPRNTWITLSGQESQATATSDPVAPIPGTEAHGETVSPTLLVAPFKLAEITVQPEAKLCVVTKKSASTAPSGTVITPGIMTSAALLLDRFTDAAPDAFDRATVQLTGISRLKTVELQVNDVSTGGDHKVRIVN
jgi:hypothetical protein